MRPSLIVTDLDNTLWDWFHMWHASFSAMLDRLAELTGLPTSTLEAEMRTVHRQVGTTEYTFVLDNLPSVVQLAAPAKPSEAFRDALTKRAMIRRQEICLYPLVRETLIEIRRQGIPIVAFTESNAYWTEWRIRKTGLDGLLNVLYSAPDQGFPDSLSRADLRSEDAAYYGLKSTEHRTTPAGYLKPQPAILETIMGDYKTPAHRTLYVGDSLMKDIAMAKSVGAVAALAKYGTPTDKAQYALLQRVSHWSDEDIAREMAILASPEKPVPDVTLRQGFWEILEVL